MANNEMGVIEMGVVSGGVVIVGVVYVGGRGLMIFGGWKSGRGLK